MEQYKLRLTLRNHITIEARLLQHLRCIRASSRANRVRDLLQAGLGRAPAPVTLDPFADEDSLALALILAPAGDVDVLQALAEIPERHRIGWLRERLLAGFARTPAHVDVLINVEEDSPPPPPKVTSTTQGASKTTGTSTPEPIAFEEPVAPATHTDGIGSEDNEDEVGPLKLRADLRGLLA